MIITIYDICMVVQKDMKSNELWGPKKEEKKYFKTTPLFISR